MKKLQWEYDKQNKEWYNNPFHTNNYCRDGFLINKDGILFVLRSRTFDVQSYIGTFSKLRQAKKVAQLIYNG